jgi:hypothetical protein
MMWQITFIRIAACGSATIASRSGSTLDMRMPERLPPRSARSEFLGSHFSAKRAFAQPVRAAIDSLRGGSEPAKFPVRRGLPMFVNPCNIKNSSTSDDEPLAQVVEHVTFNHRVPGSSPGRLTQQFEILYSGDLRMPNC